MPKPADPSGLHSELRWLSSISHLLVDMDGVLFRGGSPLPGASEFVAWLRAHDIRFRLLTNNSLKTPEENARMLLAMGIAVEDNEVFTSSLATVAYLKDQGAVGHAVYVLGETGLRIALSQAGIEITDDYRTARWVVCGLDRQVSYEKLKLASLAIERGAHFVATNSDTNLPVEEGLVPGAGALQAALIATTGVTPLVIGKPEPRMLEFGMEAIHGDRSNTAMLGDRLDTDIEAANRFGIPAIMVLTGVSRREDVLATAARPDIVLDDLPALMRAWTRVRSLGCA